MPERASGNFFHSAFTPKRTRARIILIEHFCFAANSSIASDSKPRCRDGLAPRVHSLYPACAAG
jgi:hypothetical protein